MIRLSRTVAMLAAGALLVALSAVPAVAFHDCAFLDKNDDGVFDAGDQAVPGADWIGKTYVAKDPFVVPAGCNHLSAVSVGHTHVKAPKIVFEGELIITVASASSIVLEANPDAIPGANLGDGSVTVSGTIETGGQSGEFPDHVVGNEAIHNRTITIVARGRNCGGDPDCASPLPPTGAPGVCTFSGAIVRTHNPTGSNDIGVHCNGDITVRKSLFLGARINIQSINGTIDATSSGSSPLVTLGESCDDPAKNQTPGKGNNNGVIDADDFPCALNLGTLYPGVTTFADASALAAFCDIPGGPNQFIAFNDPLIMIAGKTLDVHGSSASGGENVLLGRYRVSLAALDGDILLQNTRVSHVFTGLPPGGAHIDLSSRPTSFNTKDNDAEDFFGPFTGGVYNIDSACLLSPQKVRYGDAAASVVGTPEPSPCAQFPANFVAMPNIIHAP